MEKDFIETLAEDVSPERAYQLGMMVGKMIEAGLSTALNWAIDSNLQAFHSGIKAGLNGADLEHLPVNTAVTAHKSIEGKPCRKLRVKAKIKRAQPD